MTDLTERLRKSVKPVYGSVGTNLLTEAADELERLYKDIHSCGPTCTRAGCVAAEKIARPVDCKTCSRYRLLGGPWCDIHDQCVNGNLYQPLPPVKLWRKT